MSAPRSATALLLRLASPEGREAVVASASLALVLLHPDSAWFIATPCRVLALAMLLHRPWQRVSVSWLALGFLVLAGAMTGWASADNHRYLIGYWLLGVGVAHQHRSPAPYLDTSARLMIGACFAFATLHKLASHEFMSGSFFHFSLLQDPRLETMSRIFGLTAEAVRLNETARSVLATPSSELTAITLADAPGLARAALVMTYWTIAIEGLLALAFLSRRPAVLFRNRDMLLLGFIVTTYALAPVIGFGWLLLVMGLAQVEPRRSPWLAAGYCALLLLLQLYSTPWQRLVASIMGLS